MPAVHIYLIFISVTIVHIVRDKLEEVGHMTDSDKDPGAAGSSSEGSNKVLNTIIH